MKQPIRKEQDSAKDPRAHVYDLLGELQEPSIPHAKQLFVMGGQRGGFSGGYFYEKASADYLDDVAQVPVRDESGMEVGRLHQNMVFDAFYRKPPEWLEVGKTYQVGPAQVPEQDLQTLWNIRTDILERLRREGEEAAKEFLLVGTTMGGVEESPEVVAKDIGSTINSMLEAVKARKSK